MAKQLHLNGISVERRPAEASLAQKRAAHTRAWQKRPAILKNHHQVILGDAREFRGLRKDTEVHLVVTSPPYWNLKKYASHGNGAQLGHINDREQFLNELGKVWNRCFDALVPGGRMCVVVGDVCRSRRAHGRHVVEPLHAYIQAQCQDIGFDPLAPIIWNKIANAKTEVAGNGNGFLGKPYEPNAIIKNDVEFILLFRKPGDYRHPSQLQRDLSLISKENHRKWFQQVWTDIRGESQRLHPAPFPQELAKRLISMFSFVGDTVLDPFLGIANTSLAAMETHRSSIGFEIEPSYFEIVKRRLDPSDDSTVEFVVPGRAE
jgi:DNA modification methylase